MGPKMKKEGPKPVQDKKRKDFPHSSSAPATQGREGGLSGRAMKRVKTKDARTIATQPPESALKDGDLDLQAFLTAREFEIRALEDSMARSKAFSARRAFQMVPRGMRRRTASHNAKRVPTRLRARARREQIEDNTPTVTSKRKPRTARAKLRAETAKKLGIVAQKKRKKQLEKAAEKAKAAGKDADQVGEPGDIGKQTIQTRPAKRKVPYNKINSPPKPKSKFKKRQIDKTWLPTHMWHAKRAKMSKPLWGFSIPLTPTEKVYRATHRASGGKGTVVWDMSYMSTLRLTGPPPNVEWALRELSVKYEGDRGEKQKDGRRSWTGTLRNTQGIIGPATIIWNPTIPPTGDDQQRQREAEVFLRTHPCCFQQVFDELLGLRKQKTRHFQIQDLRFEIGSIELTGPGSTEALQGVLRPYNQAVPGKLEPAQTKLFRSLVGVTNPSSLPRDVVLGFDIADPRLQYPPRTIQPPLETVDENAQFEFMKTLATWPPDLRTIDQFGLFDAVARSRASRLPSQKYLNRRRGSSKPGEPLEVTKADPPIPIILIASHGAARNQQGTWTLLAPWSCILPIWYSLVHYPLSTKGNPRVGGLNELRQVTFERGLPWFPGDFLATPAGNQWEIEQRANRKAEWERRPKGKRVSWQALDLGAGRKGEIGDGHACDLEYLMDLLPENHTGAAIMTELNGPTPQATPAPSAHPLTITSLAKETKALAEGRKGLPAAWMPPSVATTVRLSLLGGGVVTACARIYRLPPRRPRQPPVPWPPPSAADLAIEPYLDPPLVPPTQPPKWGNRVVLPKDLRDQWLLRVPAKTINPENSFSKRNPSKLRTMPPGTNLEARKRLLAKSIVGTELPYPRQPANEATINNGDFPLVPDVEDLIGFVTTGAFNLSQGRGTAIGTISTLRANMALQAANFHNGQKGQDTDEGRLCIVRNAGENVGWIAKWETV